MNYAAHYERLIARAQARVLSGYVERHHIIPTCIGGTDDLKNLVALTPEEHYVAHQLLVKMHPGIGSLIWAASCMTGSTKRHARKNKLYGWLRRRLAETIRKSRTGFVPSAETREKMAAAKRGKSREKHTEQTKLKMALASKGKPKSDAHRAALSAAKLGVKRGPHSAEHRARQSVAIKAAMARRKQSVSLTI